MSYKVKTDIYQGPFDLLLYLVSQKKVDIGAISINEIADQYMAEISHMESLDLEVASDFLLVASTLLEIKAMSLIPREREELEEEIAELDPDTARNMLIGKLIVYKQYKNAADGLYRRYLDECRLHSRPFGPDAQFLGLMPDFLEGITMDALGLLAAKAFARREVFLLESEHIAAKPIPVEMHVEAIYKRIQTKKKLKFRELLPKDAKPELIVVTFLAILELYKRSVVRLAQESQFGTIDISYIEGSHELNFDEVVDDMEDKER